MENRCPSLTTPNLLVRLFELKDAATLRETLKNTRDSLLPWIPWAVDEPEPLNVKEAKIRKWKGEYYLDLNYAYGIFSGDGSKLIGGAFMFTRQGPGILEIGYWITHEECGKGYATEVSYALTKLGFEHIGIEKIEIHCNSDHKASARIPEKLGYKLESENRRLEKKKDGARIRFMVWVMFREEFRINPSYEPVTFTIE